MELPEFRFSDFKIQMMDSSYPIAVMLNYIASIKVSVGVLVLLYPDAIKINSGKPMVKRDTFI